MQFVPRAINFAYYASVLLDALAHILCWHNQRMPTLEYLKQRLYATKMPCRLKRDENLIAAVVRRNN